MVKIFRKNVQVQRKKGQLYEKQKKFHIKIESIDHIYFQKMPRKCIS